MEGANRESNFATQFAKTEKYKVAGGTAEVVDVRPENPKSEIPVFFAPAWGCSTEVYKPALEETIASLPGFGMAPEGHLSYSSGPNI
jgi:hypothetical protein